MIIRSKHYGQRRLFDDDGVPVYGKCRIFANSSLRKLVRAARRGNIPGPRMFIIEQARKRADERARLPLWSAFS